MKYLRKFENHTAYEAFTGTSEFILPNVSLCVNENEVHYNPSTPPTPPTPSHEYVDLGLPSGTKWATMNVGANSVTDYGNYYQYGHGAETYIEPDGSYYYEGEENPLATSADTAAQVWGGSWHMPTTAQCQELIDNTTYTWVENFNGSGINGGKFTAQNGNYVFFPAASKWYDSYLYWLGGECCYLSSSFTECMPQGFYMASGFNPRVIIVTNDSGLTIRPVMDA